MRRLFFILVCLILFLSFSLSFACKKEDGGLSFYVPDGAPALSIAKFINSNEDFKTGLKVDFNVVSASVINSTLSVKKADFVILPVLQATKLYNANPENSYKTVGVITHGNFYLISSFLIENVSELKNKIILILQNRNTVPDLTIKAILKDNNLEYVESDSAVKDKVALSYKGAGANVIGAMDIKGDNETVAYLPEPAATNLLSKKPIYGFRLSVQELFDKESKSYPQAVLLVKSSLLSSHKDLIEDLKNSFNESVGWLKDNPVLAVNNVKSVFSSSELPDKLSVNSVINSNIYFKDAKSEKENVYKYIERIRSIEKSSANEIDEGFFV